MDEEEPSGDEPGLSRTRLGLWLGTIALIAFGIFAFSLWVGDRAPWAGIGLSMLLVLPFTLGAVTELFLNPTNNRAGTWRNGGTAVAIILALSVIFLREGAICVVMLAPLWIVVAMLGAYGVSIARDSHGNDRKNVVVLSALPFLAMLLDANLPPPVEAYAVTRSVVIDASPEKIWPLLLTLDDLKPDEGAWNISQDVMGVPRPSSAIVVGEGPGATRYARWGADIRFEEHITDWRKDQALAWDFAFPDDSISRYTDRHIHPDGANLKIATGAYRLVPLSDGRTRLELSTGYLARTQVNPYAALWGELFLGDIQTNILAVVKHRAE